jgi:putative hydrolase of HD superfamily
MDDQAHKEILSDLPAEAALLLALGNLMDTERRNPLATGTRRERVAEHSWYTALGVILLAAHSPEKLDIGRAALFAIVHDICESFVGDTFAFGPEVQGQHARERAAMRNLRASHTDSEAIQLLADLWDEYEEQRTPEARFVKGMDAFLPILLNFSNIRQSSWVQHSVKAEQVQSRLDRTRRFLGELAALNDRMIQQAKCEGYLT